MRTTAALFFYVFLLLALLLLALKSFVLVKPQERAVVFRLGEFLGVLPVGLNVVLPFLDKIVKIRVDQIAGWNQMSEPELLERITQIYKST